jgi:hypothetical protein
MIKLIGEYGHMCVFSEWRLTDEHDPGFIYCKCFDPTGKLLALQDLQAIKLDAGKTTMPEWHKVRQ